MKYFVYAAFVLACSSDVLACYTFFKETEQDRQSTILYTGKAHKILERYVTMSSAEPPQARSGISPGNYHVKVENAQQERVVSVADFLKEHHDDQEEWLKKIAAYYYQRDRQKEYYQRKKEYGVDVLPPWQEAEVVAIAANMKKALTQSPNQNRH